MEKTQMETKNRQDKDYNLTCFLRNSLIDEQKYQQIKQIENEISVEQKPEKMTVNHQGVKTLEIAKTSENLQKNMKNKSKTTNKRNKLELLREKKLVEWIEIVFAVSPFIENMAEFVDGLIDKIAESSFSTSVKCGGALNVFEKTIDVIERKYELVNLSVVSSELYNLILNDEERQVVECTLDKTRKIVDIAENGKYKWVYKARDRFLKRVVEFCRRKGYDEEFFFKHFSAEPLIQYYV